MSDDLRITLKSTDHPPRPRRLLAGIALLVLTGLFVWLGVSYYNASQSLQRGKRFLRQMRNVEAEAEFQRFIRWHHSHAEARLLLAEAIVKGDRRQPQDAAEIAMDLSIIIAINASFVIFKFTNNFTRLCFVFILNIIFSKKIINQ